MSIKDLAHKNNNVTQFHSSEPHTAFVKEKQTTNSQRTMPRISLPGGKTFITQPLKH